MRKPTPRSFAAFLALSVLISAPARADDPQPPPQAPASDDRQRAPEAATPPSGSPDEVVCKVRSEPAIGSKINRRLKICRPRRDWEEETRTVRAR